jgi:hypothetical protein
MADSLKQAVNELIDSLQYMTSLPEDGPFTVVIYVEPKYLSEDVPYREEGTIFKATKITVNEEQFIGKVEDL